MQITQFHETHFPLSFCDILLLKRVIIVYV